MLLDSLNHTLTILLLIKYENVSHFYFFFLLLIIFTYFKVTFVNYKFVKCLNYWYCIESVPSAVNVSYSGIKIFTDATSSHLNLMFAFRLKGFQFIFWIRVECSPSFYKGGGPVAECCLDNNMCNAWHAMHVMKVIQDCIFNQILWILFFTMDYHPAADITGN